MRAGRNPMGRPSANLSYQDVQDSHARRRSRFRDAGRKSGAIASMAYKTPSIGDTTGRRASSADADDSTTSIFPTWLTDLGILGDLASYTESERQQQDPAYQEDSWWSSLEQGVKDVTVQVVGPTHEDDEADAEEITWEEERDMLLGIVRTQRTEAAELADAEGLDVQGPSSSTVVQMLQSQKQLAIREERSRIQSEEDRLRNEILQQQLQMYAVSVIDSAQLLNSAREVRRTTLRTSRAKQLAQEQDARALRMMQMESLARKVTGSKQMEDARLARSVEAAQDALNVESSRTDAVCKLDATGAVSDRSRWALQHEFQAALRAVADCGETLRKLRPSIRRAQHNHEIDDKGLRQDPGRRQRLAQQYLDVLQSQAPSGTATVHTRFGAAYTHWSDSGMRLQ